MLRVLSLALLISSCASLNFRDYHLNIRKDDTSQIRQLEKEKLLALMNTSVNPCDDFFEYACGGWRTISDFGEVFDILDKKIEEALSQPEEFYKTEAQKRTKQFYDRCNSEVEENGGNTSWLGTEVLRRYEGWLRESQDLGNFSWIDIAGTLARQGIEVFFKMDSELDEGEIVPTIKLHLTDRFQESNFIKAFQLDQLNYNASEIEVIIQRSEEVYKEVSKNWAKYRKQQFVKIPLGPERDSIVSFDIERYLSVRFQDKLNKKFILVDGPEEVSEAADFLNTVRPDLMSAYFLFSIAEFLYGEFFISSKLKCLEITQKYFRPPVLGIFTDYYFGEEARRDLAQIMESLKEQQYRVFNSTPWFDDTTKQGAFDKIHAVGTELSFDSVFGRESSLSETFEKMDLNGGNIFEAIIFNDLLGKKLNALIENELTDGYHIGWYERDPFAITAGFLRAPGPLIYVPAGIALSPYYDYGYPYFRKYGGYGSAIGHELMHNFDSKQYKLDSKLERSKWWSPKLSTKIDEDYRCLYSVYAEEQQEAALMNIDENVADSLGVKASYNAYKSLLSKGEITEEGELSGFEDTGFNLDQLFFLSFAQTFCFIEPWSTKGVDFGSGPHAKTNIRVRGTASNSEYFADVFDCPVESPMNPEKKCKYYA